MRPAGGLGRTATGAALSSGKLGPSGPFKLMSDHDIIKVLRDRIRATSEVDPIKSQLHTRGYDIPAVRCIQRAAVVRRHLAKAKRDITQAEDELDQLMIMLIAGAAVCIQRTVSAPPSPPCSRQP